MARDAFHGAAKRALIKDGWIITHDPLNLKLNDGTEIFIDLGAERMIAAEKNGMKIAVEVKNFISASAYHEFHTALGQFLNYREVILQIDPDRDLYLTVPIETYQGLFQRETIRRVIDRYDVKLVIFDPYNEEVVSWQK